MQMKLKVKEYRQQIETKQSEIIRIRQKIKEENHNNQ